MRLFVVQRIGYEYNDEFYRRESGEGFGLPVKAFLDKGRADAECGRLNAERAKQAEEGDWGMGDCDGEPISLFYEVAEVEVEEDEVEDYASARAKVEEARKKARASAERALEVGAKELFDANPELRAFGWVQYTPYFNDGDPCTFLACTSDPFVFAGEMPGDDEDDYYTSEGNVAWDSPLREKVADFCSSFADEDLKSLFDDHVRVVIERGQKPRAEEYFHD